MHWVECKPDAFQNAPSPRMGHVALAVDARESWGEELLLVHGGLSEDKLALADLLCMPCSGTAWFVPQQALKGPVPPARAFHAGAVIGSRAFIFGGHVWLKDKKALHKFNDVWSLNTDSWEWTRMEVDASSPQPSPRDFACLVDLPGKRLLLHGGLDSAEKRLDDTWILDTSLGTWSEVKVTGAKPKARYAHGMVSMDTRVLLFGGEGNAGVLNDLWTLRGVVNEGEEAPAWILLGLPGMPPTPRKGHSMAPVGLWLVVMGGRTAEVGWFRTKTDIFVNDVVVMERDGVVAWRTPALPPDAAQGPPPREFHSLTLLPGGRLLLLGGGNGKTIFGDAWILDTENEPYVGKSLVALLSGSSDGLSGELPTKVPLPVLGATDAALQGQDSALQLTGRSVQEGPMEQKAQAQPPPAAQANWWKGAQEGSAMEALRVSMGLPAHPPAAEAREGAGTCVVGRPGPALHRLGTALLQQQGVQSAPDSLAVDAARQHLLACPVEALRLEEVGTMLEDVKLLTRGCLRWGSGPQPGRSPRPAAAPPPAWEPACSRFYHVDADDVRVADVAALQSEYAQLLEAG